MKSFCNDIIPYITLDEKISAIEDFGDIPKPALIVEGKTDVSVYSRMFKLSELNIEEFDFIVGKCKSNIMKYYKNNAIPFKYVALIDSDFDKLRNTLLEEDCFVYTHFYDMENYLTTIDVIEYTFEDLNDVYTNKITTEELYNNMIGCLYAYIVAAKYKLDFLIKYDKQDEEEEEEQKSIFPLEDKSIVNEQWWDKQSKTVSLEKMKKWIIENCEKNNIEFNEILWEKLCEETRDELDYNTNLKNVQLLLKGRRLIEAYKIVFEKYLGEVMKKRDKDVYKNDLRKNIEKSSYVNDLMKELDLRLREII